MKKTVSIIVSAALLTVGLVACPDKTEVTPPAEVVTTELILNGGFEANTSNGTFTGDGRRNLSPVACRKTGTYFGSISKEKSSVGTAAQTINVPAQGTTTLKYWVRIDSNVNQASASDSLLVKVNEKVISTLTTADPQEIYKEYSADLTELAGKSATIQFRGTFKDIDATNFCIDDVSAINSK